jgi:adenosine kinase
MARYANECTELSIPYFYDPSQQIVRLDAGVLRQGIEGAHALFVNDYEFSLVQKATQMSQEEILSHLDILTVTSGEKGADIYTRDEAIHIPVFLPEKIVDPTGVGDAFRAGFLVGFGRGWNLELCGQLGSLAATYCLENNGPQGHIFSTKEFVHRFRQQVDDAGILDALIEK